MNLTFNPHDGCIYWIKTQIPHQFVPRLVKSTTEALGAVSQPVGWLVGGLLLAAMFVVNEPLTLVVLQEHTTDLSAAQPEV